MVILHLVFKLVAVLLYLITLHSFITTFILVTLLLSADFWVVKNICGRLLAGLRWWSIVDEEGEVKPSCFSKQLASKTENPPQLQWKYETWSSEERAMAKQVVKTLFNTNIKVLLFIKNMRTSVYHIFSAAQRAML